MVFKYFRLKFHLDIYHHCCDKMNNGNKYLVCSPPFCISVERNDHGEGMNCNKSKRNDSCQLWKNQLNGKKNTHFKSKDQSKEDHCT